MIDDICRSAAPAYMQVDSINSYFYAPCKTYLTFWNHMILHRSKTMQHNDDEKKYFWNHMILHRSKTVNLTNGKKLSFWNHMILHRSKTPILSNIPLIIFWNYMILNHKTKT